MFPGDKHGISLFLALEEITKTTLSGEEFALVGHSLARS
jgi:hypothetical protein